MEVINCTLDIQVDGKLNKIDVKELTKINPLTITDQICECASNIAFYGLLHSKAKSVADRLEWIIKKTKAQVDLEIRATRKDKLTQGQIDSLVENDTRVINAYEEYFKARSNEQILYSFLMSLIAMKELLITLSANMRAEIKGED